MARFYTAQNESQGAQSVDLTSLDAADVSAYRWNAMARFYEAQTSQAEINLSK
jgi:hypothetical protein